jgi:hypothetical protein
LLGEKKLNFKQWKQEITRIRSHARIILRNLSRNNEGKRGESSLPLRVFQVEAFCAVAQPSDSRSRSRGEPRRDKARLLLPIADRHQFLQKRWLRARQRQSREAEDGEGKRRGDEASGAMGVRQPRWIFKTG